VFIKKKVDYIDITVSTIFKCIKKSPWNSASIAENSRTTEGNIEHQFLLNVNGEKT